MNNMVASLQVNESPIMLVKRAKWIRSVNNGHGEMIKEVRVVHKGMGKGSPS